MIITYDALDVTIQLQGLLLAVADLRGARGTCVPRGPKFFQFHAVFGKIWQNCMLAPPPGVGAPSSGKSWIRHCLALIPFCVQGSIHPDMFELVHNKASTVRMESGRLASYWNIFLFQSFLLHSMIFRDIRRGTSRKMIFTSALVTK